MRDRKGKLRYPFVSRRGEKTSRRQFVFGLGMLSGMCAFKGVSAETLSQGRTFYVSPSGSDQNVGSEYRPFATFGGLFRKIPDIGGGDTIIAKPGVYHEAVMVRAGGNASGNLVIRSQVPRAAFIRSPINSYSAITVLQNYVTIDGFDVQSGGSGHGIEATFIDGNNRKNGPHHIFIKNTVCHNNAGSGISVSYGDFYRIENNVCYRNCATNAYQGSGISVYSARAVAGTERLRILVVGNTCYDNIAIKLPGDVPHSDGNGIIVDDLRNTQTRNPSESYPYATLIENNVCYSNGGKGIHVFLSDNVIVRNNTACYNNKDLKNPATWRGELSNVDSFNCVWINNIAVADRSSHPKNAAILDALTSGLTHSDTVWMRNLTFDGRPGVPSVTVPSGNKTLTSNTPYSNILGKDPLFVMGPVSVSSPDFRLLPGSPAINAGLVKYGNAMKDRGGQSRIQGRGLDLGAFESRSP